MSRIDVRASYLNPAEEGALRRLTGVEDEVPWEAWIQWADGGWTKTVALRIGHATASPLGLNLTPNFNKAGVAQPGIDLPAVAAETAARIAAHVEHRRADIDLTQRAAMVFRAVEDGALAGDQAPEILGGRRFAWHGSGQHDEVAIVAGLYELFADLGRRSPTEDVATALHLTRATAGRRVAEARKRELLPPARPGTSGMRRRA